MPKLNLDQPTLKKLQMLSGSAQMSFLGYTLNLETAELTDNLQQDRALTETAIQILSTLLAHYAKATIVSPSGKLVKYKDLPGGSAYEGAFNKRAVQPIADGFGCDPMGIVAAAQKFGGKQAGYGEASAVIPALAGLPLTYIVWGCEEYPAAASILYDESASLYLPTEDLAVLGEIATIRLLEAKNA